jgi:hypothetical protein
LQLGIEFVTLTPLALKVPAWFELLLSAGQQVVPESFGKDEYMYPVHLPAHARITATGRKCLFLNHQKVSATVYQAGPSEPVELPPLEPAAHLMLFIATSLSLTPRELARAFGLNLVTPAKEHRIALKEEAIEPSGNGKFVINLSALLQSTASPLSA